MRNIEILGFGTAVPKNTVDFDGQIRYRSADGETQLSLAVEACTNAFKNANLKNTDVDLIVSASAVGIQPIPCTAALIHEAIALGTDIPAMDINTTCTSFITALDTVSYFIEAGKYKRVLIVSSELASAGLNKDQKESYELFSDSAAAVIVGKSDGAAGILCSVQKTWSEGAHSTEIRGGLTNLSALKYDGTNYKDFLFDMKGIQILSFTGRKLPPLMNEFYKANNISLSDIDKIIPHQASRALGVIMKRLNIPEDKYVDRVSEYGNMVSASVPYTLCKCIEDGTVKKGDTIMLVGTAAGLTINILVLKY